VLYDIYILEFIQRQICCYHPRYGFAPI